MSDTQDDPGEYVSLYRVTFVCDPNAMRVLVVRASDARDAYAKAVNKVIGEGDTLDHVTSFNVEDLYTIHYVE